MARLHVYQGKPFWPRTALKSRAAEQLRLLLPRIGLGDDQANRMLIKSLETAIALQISPNDALSTLPQNAFVVGIRELKWELIDRH